MLQSGRPVGFGEKFVLLLVNFDFVALSGATFFFRGDMMEPLPIKIDLYAPLRDIDWSFVFDSAFVKFFAALLSLYGLIFAIYWAYYIYRSIVKIIDSREKKKLELAEKEYKDVLLLSRNQRKEREVKNMMLQSMNYQDASGNWVVGDVSRLMSREDAEEAWEREERRKEVELERIEKRKADLEYARSFYTESIEKPSYGFSYNPNLSYSHDFVDDYSEDDDRDY